MSYKMQPNVIGVEKIDPLRLVKAVVAIDRISVDYLESSKVPDTAWPHPNLLRVSIHWCNNQSRTIGEKLKNLETYILLTVPGQELLDQQASLINKYGND